MKAIFIAAGSGSRLGNITKNLPKPLVDINGKSLLERQIALLRKNNIDEIVIVTGYLKEKFELKNVEYIFNPLYSVQEQACSLMSARKIFDDEILIMFGDILFDEKILKQILDTNDDIVIAIDKNWEKSYDERLDNPKSKADKVLVENDKILEISANVVLSDDADIGELLGIIKLSAQGSKKLLDIYEKLEKYHTGKFHDAESFKKAKFVDILQELLQNKVNIMPVSINGKWCEIDTLDDLNRAKKLFV